MLLLSRGSRRLLPLFLAAACAGQQGIDESGAAVQTAAEIRTSDHNDTSAPLTLMPPAPRSNVLVEHEVKRIPRPRNNQVAAEAVDAVHQSRFVNALSMPATLTNFDGVGQGFSGPQGSFTVNSAPPDTNGDVGPNHYVQVVNTDLAVFSKTGTVLYGPVPINTIWSGFGGLCQTDNDGDPVVLYDPIADRWVVSQFAVSGTTTGYLQCVAVSKTPDPTGAWNRYSFSYGSSFPDYPKMGVWPDAYYETFNMFNSAGTSFLGGKVCAYDRAKMLAGAAATQQCFDVGTTYGGLLPADLDGARLPPAGAPNYVIALGATTTSLAFWKFHVDWTTPSSSTLTGPTALTVPAYTEACGTSGTCIPQSGTNQKLDSLSDRTMFRLAYRNFGDHEAMVTNHAVTVGTTVGVRWYEVRVANGTPSVFQSGTYSPDANFRWMGSMAFDQSGNLALGFSVSSSSLKPEIRYTGRLAGDAAGQMTQGESTVIAGGGSQGRTLSRWGDYSMMSVDPVDDCTFWYTTEYIPANGTFNWKTRIGSFKFPGCGPQADFSISANPNALTMLQGGAGTSTVSTAIVGANSGTVNLAVSGVPSGASATLNPTSVTAGGSSTLTVNAGTATPGTYTLTVTGTEGSQTHSATVSLTVQAIPDFSISSSPAALTLAQGAGGSSAISTAVTAGSAGTVNLSVSGVPAGASATLTPASVTAGTGSTLAVNAGTATPGSYVLTVTGTEGSKTHSTTVTLNVPANDFGISVGSQVISLVQGASSTDSIFTALTSGNATVVSFSVTGAPAGANASISPASAVAGSGATLTVDSGTAAPGTYGLVVSGTNGTFTHNLNVSLTITAPVVNDFSISSTPGALTLPQGADGSTSISTALLSGSVESLSLSLQSPLTASLSDVAVNTGGSVTLSVNAGSATPGDYALTVTASGAQNTHSVTVVVTVTAPPPNDFSLHADPSSLSLVQGASGSALLTTAVTSGDAEQIGLSVAGAPDGASATIDVTSLTGAGTATLSVNAGTAAPGTYALTVTGTSPSATHTATVTLVVSAPIPNDFSISASPNAFPLVQGTSGSSTISTFVISGSAESLSLSVSGALSASFDTNNITAGGQATLTVAAGNAAPGSYTLTVTATGASASHSVDVTVTVTAPVINDFSVSATPASLSMGQGGTGVSNIGTVVVSGSAETLSLSVSGVPGGATATFGTNNVTTGGGTTLTVNAGTATPGSYTLTVTATGSSNSHGVSVPLTIVANDFSISAAPASVSIAAGGNGSTTISTATLSGNAQSVSLSASGLPAGVSASFSPASVTSGNSSTLNLSVAGSAVAGTYTLTVTGTAASGSHSTTVSLTVTPGANQLSNGVPVNNLSGATNATQTFTLNVPAGQGQLTFQLSGGSGDADMYVKFGSAPTLSTYDCRPFVAGNSESCSFSNPAAGTWYVMLNGFSAYSGVSLVGTFGPDTTTALVNGQTVANISGAKGSQQFWKLTVPAGKTTLTFKLSGGSGDADLYVKRAAKPTLTTYDCRPFITGNNETCTFNNPVAADYYVMLNGFAAYSATSLLGQYSP